MILSRSKKFVFLAFNKTGSTSIESVLSRYQSAYDRLFHRLRYDVYYKPRFGVIYKHVSAWQAKEFLGETVWDRYITICFVRNPWDRMVSLYSYHKRAPKYSHLVGAMGFDDWVRSGGTGTARRLMSDFVSDRDGRRIVDFIGRYENLNQDFDRLLSKLGIRGVSLPHKNKSDHMDYREYYTEETREIVSGWVKRDAEMFGYKF